MCHFLCMAEGYLATLLKIFAISIILLHLAMREQGAKPHGANLPLIIYMHAHQNVHTRLCVRLSFSTTLGHGPVCVLSSTVLA